MRAFDPSQIPSRVRAIATRVAVTLALLLVHTGAANAQQTGAATLESVLAPIESQIAAEVASDGIGGMTVGVVRNGEVEWIRGFGWADVERGIPAGPETIYRVGSISKSFTAIAMLQAVQDGAISLDDPVSRYFPAVDGFTERPDGADDITFRHLASHTAGLIREPQLQGAASGPIEGWEEKILASIPQTRYQALPGAEYSYSNIGFGVLGMAVGRATGTPFMAWVEERIFEPLDMTHSTFVIGPELEPQLATGYRNRQDGTVDSEGPAREHAGRGYKVPNGGVYSTVRDLGRFVAGVTGTTEASILDSEWQEAAVTKQTPEDRPGGYGLGFSLQQTDDGRHFAGHGGSVAGYTAHLLFDVGSGVGVVLLRNYNSGETNLGGTARTILTTLVDAGYVREEPDLR